MLGCGKPITNTDWTTLQGEWYGFIQVSDSSSLYTVLHIKLDDKATPVFTVDSPMQNAYGIGGGKSRHILGRLELEFPSLKAQYRFTIAQDSRHLQGKWFQRGRSFPLDFSNDPAVAQAFRPQEPKPPYPYSVENVSISSQGNILSGTLTFPQSQAPSALIVCISGSGPSDRDESYAGHKPFLVLADRLTREGFAVLRYDDRGVGSSTGDHAAATTFDFAEDAEAVFSWLKTYKPEWQQLPAGYAGHSEGALIAALLACRGKVVPDFAVLLGCPAFSGDELLLQQNEALLRAEGVSEKKIQETMLINRRIYDLLLYPTKDSRETILTELEQAGVHKKDAEVQLELLESAWFRTFLAFDPAEYLGHCTIPLLALYGNKDLQVPSPQNPDRMKQILHDNPHELTVIEVIPGLNHMFQQAETGKVSEYGLLVETINIRALDKITAWLKAVSN